jgi:hypothetical protein
MKAYICDFNNVLLELSNRVEKVSDPKDADVIITWQDVRGGMKELAEINASYLKKPLVVVQHGRGATRDYNAPNNFKLVADKICVWGQTEADRMINAGYANKTVITGSPLTFYTRNAEAPGEDSKKNKIILYMPVITSKEEPDNLIAFYKLKQIEYAYAEKRLLKHYKELKALWKSWQIDPTCATESNIPYDLFRQDFFLMSKITTIHDRQLYHGPIVQSTVNHSSHLYNTIKLISNSSCVVGLEEGTAQLMAAALNIPCVIVDGFKYGEYGGVKDYSPELIKTGATAFTDLENIEQTILEEIENKHIRQDAREKVVREEFDPFPDKDPIELIIDVASELAGGDIRLNKLESVNG